MASPTPTRPLESLDWYRDSRHRSPQSNLEYWLRGIGLLSAHISLFALGSVALFVVNLLRDPANLWIDQVILIWAILLVVHLVVVGALFLLGQLGDENDEALEILPSRTGRGMASWPRRPVRNEDVRDVDFRVTTPEIEPSVTQAAPESAPKPSQSSIWEEWGAEAPQPISKSEAQPSWQEATTWLSRRRTKDAESESTPTPTEADTEPRA